MPQNELFEIAELVDREVGSKGGLHSLFANNAYTNVSLKNHADVVASITH